MNALPNYDTWKLAAPDDGGPEPTEAQIEEAFGELVQDSDLLADFIECEQPDYTTPFQLFHANDGLPRMDGSEQDDALRKRWQIAMDGFFAHYRDWLGDRLTVKADEVMQAEMQAAREDAEEYAADCRREAMGWCP